MGRTARDAGGAGRERRCFFRHAGPYHGFRRDGRRRPIFGLGCVRRGLWRARNPRPAIRARQSAPGKALSCGAVRGSAAVLWAACRAIRAPELFGRGLKYPGRLTMAAGPAQKPRAMPPGSLNPAKRLYAAARGSQNAAARFASRSSFAEQDRWRLGRLDDLFRFVSSASAIGAHLLI